MEVNIGMAIAVYNGMKNKRILIGDCESATEALYSDQITISDAQALSDLLTDEMDWPRVLVIAGRQTIRRHGRINGIYTSHPVMTLNKPSVGVVLHELAHMVNRDLKTGCGHGASFKSAQRFLIKLWM
jgi:hypothetical protein